MRVLGISGSPRRGGNTDMLIHTALATLAEEGIEASSSRWPTGRSSPAWPAGLLQARKRSAACKTIRRSRAFWRCSPRPTASWSARRSISARPRRRSMALLDRVGYVARRHPKLLRRKVGAAIVVARRAGQNFTFAQLNYFFLISEMIVPGSTYWNVAFGREKGEVRNDAEGMETVKNLARNMAWLMKKIKWRIIDAGWAKLLPSSGPKFVIIHGSAVSCRPPVLIDLNDLRRIAGKFGNIVKLGKLCRLS